MLSGQSRSGNSSSPGTSRWKVPNASRLSIPGTRIGLSSRRPRTLGWPMSVMITLIGQPNVRGRRLDNPIRVPGMLSLLAFGTFHRDVPGLLEFPERDWPDNIELLYYAFHVMAGLGTLMIALTALATLLGWLGRLE